MSIKRKILFHCPNIKVLRQGISKFRIYSLGKDLLPDSVILDIEADKDRKSEIVEKYLKKENTRFLKIKPMMESILKEHYAELSNDKQKDIFEDMVFCFFAYGFQPDEYFFFELENKSVDERKAYVSDIERTIYFMQINDICEGEVFLDKSKTYQFYKKYYKRNAIVINRCCHYSDFERFIHEHPVFVKKRVDLSRGEGVELVDIRKIEVSKREYFEQLKATNVYQLEEKIKQSKIMSSLNESSVNTIRCIAFVTHHGVKVPFTFLKVGRRGSFVDNGCAGGILIGIDEKTGILNTDGADEYGNRFVMHPDSSVQLKGFRLPDWEEVLQLCKEITPMVKGVRAIGWDLAHTDRGWVIVEGNLFGQFVGPQITRRQGLKKEWMSVMEDMEI